MKNVIVTYELGGWYSFSTCGHSDYTRNNDIHVRGYMNLVKSLREYGLKCSSIRNVQFLSQETVMKIQGA